MFAQSYWEGFIDHWSKVYRNQDAAVVTLIGVGAVAIFIITRGKWKK